MEKFLPLLIIISFSLISVFTLFHKGLPPTHDGEYHVVRFYEFDKVLRQGNLYPRWAPDFNNGYGIPLFNYVYPFPNYIASFFHIFNISFIDAFKLSMIVATILGAFFFYLWSKEIWGREGGILSSIFYLYSPYRFLDVFVRGSVGEVWALAFFPACLWSLEKIHNKNKSLLFKTCSGLLLALMIFSHNILGLMFFTFSFLYMIFLIVNKKQSLFSFIYIVVLSLSLASIFWMPALLESKFVKGLEIYRVSNNFPEIYQLLIPSWGTGFSEGDLNNQMSFQVGVANLFAFVLSLFGLVSLKRRKDKRAIYLFLSTVSFLVVFFLMTKSSLIIWNNVGLLSYFQFPWRFLSLEIVIVSFMAGSIPYVFLNKKTIVNKILFYLLILGTVFISISYSFPAYYLEREDQYYTTRENFIRGTNSAENVFNTVWFNTSLPFPNKKVTLKTGEASIKMVRESPQRYLLNVNAFSTSSFLVNTSFFPGWTVYDNGKIIESIKTKDGLFTFSIPAGEHTIQIIFKETFIRTFSSIISYVTIFWIIAVTTYYCCGKIRVR